MLLSAVSVLVVAQSSSEIPEALMNNLVYIGRSGVHIPVTKESFLQKRPDRLRGPPSLLSSGYRFLPWGESSWCLKLTTQFNLVKQLRTLGTRSHLPLHTFMAWTQRKMYRLNRTQDLKMSIKRCSIFGSYNIELILE